MKKILFCSYHHSNCRNSSWLRNPINLYGRDAEGRNGVVAAAKPEASQVGVAILEMGGECG